MTVYEYAHRPKATYKGKVRDKHGDAVHLFYEYRGHEYMITDEHNGYSEPMHIKHQYEQSRIDALIEAEEKQKVSANSKGFDLEEIWAIISSWE